MTTVDANEEEATVLPYPVEQLKLLHTEIDRQRSMLAQRLANLHTRAAILVTASGILSTLIIANWASYWQFIGVVIGAIAAVIGLWAMKPRRGPEARATQRFIERLGADPFSTEYSIVDDNRVALEDDYDRVESTGSLVTRGYVVLVVAWLFTLVVAALTSLNWI
ncbi:membrane protein implicated in regulation of membrane protease activity [Arthrobacter sp. UYCu511]|uniref:hypothetical protein n=1 Tax=Arthrobacter sp. UYCu511 TaxID=3156337 RepID=UPI003399ACC8